MRPSRVASFVSLFLICEKHFGIYTTRSIEGEEDISWQERQPFLLDSLNYSCSISVQNYIKLESIETRWSECIEGEGKNREEQKIRLYLLHLVGLEQIGHLARAQYTVHHL